MNTVLVLDWDGTIHDTSHLYGCAFRAAYRWLLDMDYVDLDRYPDDPEYYTDSYMEQYLGMNSKDMWNSFMPDLAPERKEMASKRVGDGMVTQIQGHQAKLYIGAIDALQKLKEDGYTLIFLSNCKRAYMEAHRKEFNLDAYYDGFYCCEDYGFIPKEEIWKDIKKDFPGFHIIVGDRAGDLKIAKIHKLPSIGCAYGFGSEEELSIASSIAKQVQELPYLVSQLL